MNDGVEVGSSALQLTQARPDVANDVCAVVADARQGGVVPLAWVKTGPQHDAAKRLAEVFGRMFGASEKWVRLAGLLQEVRGGEAPEETVRYYAGPGLEATRVRRYFLAAGFVRLAGT